MKYITPQMINEKGSITVVALMILVVLTLIGISVSRTSTIDMQIARNQIPYKQNFYVAEGGQNREAAEIGAGNYPVMNIDASDSPITYQGSDTNPHTVSGKTYTYDVTYKGYFPPPTGYSIIHFSRYDYTVHTEGGDSGAVEIDARYYKIGPKAE